MREWPNPNIPNQFFRMMHDEVPLMVGPCGHFFEQDEYEMVSVWMQGAGWGEPAATLSAGSWSHINHKGHGMPNKDCYFTRSFLLTITLDLHRCHRRAWRRATLHSHARR